MRNIMLAATALVGMTALTAGYASAQTAEPGLTTDSFNSGLATGATIAPGTITVRFRSELWSELSYAQDSATKTATGKESGVLLGSYFRLYPKFDAKAANGLEYGATAEIRMNSGGAGSNTLNTLFVRRYNGYFGTPTLGRVYVGPENMALGRLSAGTTMEDADYNGFFNGDIPTAFNSNVAPSYGFLRQSNTYAQNNLVYISPSFAGFTFGTSWEPTQATADQEPGTASTLNATSSSISGGANVRRNTYDVAVNYKGSFGPVAVTSFIGYVGSGVVNDSAATALTAKYKGWSIVAGGARVTYGPFAIGGNVNFGQINNNNGLIRQGQKNGTNIVAGAQYTIGQLIFGGQYINELNGGQYNSNATYTRSMLHETGYALGGAYDIAPGFTAYGTVAYFQRHQFGTGFVAGTSNTSVGNSVQGRAVQIGTTFRW
jgi:hypothetical protein